jgi:two-component system, NtrC family, response regulator AtoC
MMHEPAASPFASGPRDIPEQILFGRSAAMGEVRARVQKVASTKVPVLIVGESGTGKELIARYIHSRSDCSDGPFVRINCHGIPGALLESELFGHEKDLFTGETVAKAGLVESASGGTLFINGIGEMEFSLQSKLLQFLQDREFTRIGGQENLRVDLRIICAARRPLELEIECRRFREDLLYRINVVTVELPPLRDRRFDIPELIDFFLHACSKEFGRAPRPITAATTQLLEAGDWPGNIRQLENVIKRYVILDSEDTLLANISGREPVALTMSPVESQPVSLKEATGRATRELERRLILETLSANQWHRKKTAEALHISYRALLYKMKQCGFPMKNIHPATDPEESTR